MPRLNRHPEVAAILVGVVMVTPLALLYAQSPHAPRDYDGAEGGPKLIEEGQPPVMIHPTVTNAAHGRAARAKRSDSTSGNLSYNGGVDGIGVETTPKIYLVLWGSQWDNNDPSNEAGILQAFYSGVGGSSWLNSVTQYCQGVPFGTAFCDGAGQPAGNQRGIFAGYWYDDAASAPSRPRQSQFAFEAVRAAAHFGNTTAASNASAQYVIATATQNNSHGFETQYCAYHSATGSAYGNIAYTNLPYITDAGASCGADFNGLGPTAGITIVGGHEMAETITDQFPNAGWTDSSGAENGDKCAWISSGQGASTSILLHTGTFAVQSLWSNAFNGGAGGCVVSYP